MSELAHDTVLPLEDTFILNPPRHSVLVRVTHWINSAAFLALVVSGIAILMAHPRLYWGQTGAFGGPALIEVPLPLDLDQSGWGRGLHFLAAWVCALNGAVYVLSGFLTRHFFNDKAYSAAQRLAYMSVVFALFPLMILSGLAMSPAVTSAFPFVVEVFGGHQSSRTIHFLIANLLVLFLIAHVVMVYLSDFGNKMRSMITGRESGRSGK
jgi:thiosulfate reductase cytochrome b subunit